MTKKYKFDDTDKTIQPVPIVITEGKCEGVKLQYGRIAFNEKDDGMELKFDYELIENPKDLEEDQEFIDGLGEILVSVLEDEMEEIDGDFLEETGETVSDENS